MNGQVKGNDRAVDLIRQKIFQIGNYNIRHLSAIDAKDMIVGRGVSLKVICGVSPPYAPYQLRIRKLIQIAVYRAEGDSGYLLFYA